jgi:Cu/Ag efflux pump CusA
MKWVMERDLLIAQTMAFVESVAGKKKPEADVRTETRSSSVIEFEHLESPVEAEVTPPKPPVARSVIREEIEGRVAAFRAHQQRFDRERDKHFNSVLTGIRSAITDPSRTSTP